MDSIITFAKENIQLISLFVGILGVIVAVLSLIDELRRRKHRKEKEQ